MWIKICGIRDVETAVAVAALEVQAIGLNFFARSPRVIETDSAARIVANLPPNVEPVGVFVNHTVSEIENICGRTGLRTVQLHGDEPPDVVAALTARFRIIRAFRVGNDGIKHVAEYLDRCRELGAMPVACLVDANVAGHYGGTGHTAPWNLLRRDWKTTEWPPLILAGGLRPDNVAEAIQSVQPWGVDVAGGVESASGVKDIEQVREFVTRVRAVGE
jgi:phosphoribosylanthranilate isomerase